MKKNEIPEGFTLPLAFMDLVPVLFFSITMISLVRRFHPAGFVIGAVLIVISGILKVLWKIILAAGKINIPILSRQLRFLMPAGFVLLTAALVVCREDWSPQAVAAHILSFPAILFFIFGEAGIVGMIYYSAHLDRNDARANWTEEITNAFAQFFFMLAALS